MTYTIELQQVAKSFGNQKVLKDIDLNLKQGEILGLIGPSGAGKSTVINIALGVEQADSGQANILNQTMPNRQLLAEIGYMAQSDALYEALTAYENVAFFAEMKGINKQGLDQEIKRVADIVSLGDALYKNVAGFSGGMKRRLSLAIALIGNPRLLVLDEPTVGIDPALRRQIWHELHKMRDAGHAILVTTHVMDEAELVDRVALLLGGRIIANDAPKKLEAAYGVPTIEDVFLKAEEEESND
ncbi:ABC transporter ATP-binding protein [Convivina intestini]|uniref:ABC-2 type transport system ATP-binding protein n=1 Tax=Convivina intestini TaxID=1505726 RepID=A0A2U1D639_9LACO|nr:ABC transporter ATP-binding protein [Convivina intestini]PVY83138.1 ABC-2 type transport system ATP-binding protein [Convivina intestini]CAH1856352.1 putative multidrug ABC transporter ATP-binding protein YbhF [Convivina intestini]SDB95223.1 ABC-2 type transport system ATP-binding protein [Leuconostocaceae bacterium R-53105]